MANTQHYFLDATLLNSRLIRLSRYEISPTPDELQAGRNITVKIQDGDTVKEFPGCHIDDTKNRRLFLPVEAMLWIKREFPFSAAYFMDENVYSIWKKSDVKEFSRRLKRGEKLDIPGETLLITWVEGEKPYLYLQVGFRITLENAEKVLSEKAMAKVLPYIFSSVQNTSYMPVKAERGKCYVIDYSTPWLSAEAYARTAFSHPGIYILRRKDRGEYFYYVGKADDVKNRIVTDKDAVFHPTEKDEENKRYEELCCVSINMDALKAVYGVLDDTTRTPENNPGVPAGCDVDKALYALEDLVIHTVSMVLKGEGKKLDNRQYRAYTTESLLK